MKKTFSGALFLFALVLLFGAAPADAQQSCYECDPMYSYCSDSCWYCQFDVDPEYGACPGWAVVNTTCGNYMGACLDDNCTPNWVTTDRTTIGQYGETTYGVQCNPWPYCVPAFGCDHHRVDRVTQTDQNECNINSSYHERQYCHDYVDFSLPHQTGSGPNCCAYPYYCNDWHSCF